MADKKKARPATRFSPKGVAHFPWLNTADYTKWVNGVKDGEDRNKGKYKTGLILEKSNPEHAKFLKWLEEAFADAVKQGYQEMVEKAGDVNVKKKYPNLFDKQGDFKEASKPWKDDIEDENKVIVSFSMNAQYEDKKNKGTFKPLEPQLWTAGVKPWPRNVVIGGGSEIIVSFVPNPFVMAGVGAGLSLQIEGVQVIVLKSFGKKTAEQSGFAAQAGSEPDPSEGQDTGGFGNQSGDGEEPPPPGDEDAPPAGGREF